MKRELGGMGYLILAVAMAALVSIPAFAVQSDRPSGRIIVPNIEIQSYIRSLISTNRQMMFEGTEESLSDRLKILRKMAGKETDLAMQLMYFSTHTEDEREAMLPGFILQQLAISNAVFAEVCIPMLDSEDEPTRQLGADWLTRADHVSKGGVDFNRYEPILREQNQNPSQGLIRYMYWRNPEAALFSMARIYGDKAAETNLIEQLKGNKKIVLPLFVDRPEWWMRLYVVEMMGKHPQLRDPVILKKLEQDADPLVREKASKLKAELQSK
ncbi:MAG: hypothetical protein R6X19_03570 [Kiritimatiellia bacterium]